MSQTYKKLTYSGYKTLCGMTEGFKVKTNSSDTSTKYISNMFVKRFYVSVTSPVANQDYENNLTCYEFAFGDGTYTPGTSDCWRCFTNVVGASNDGAFCTFFDAKAIHSSATNLKMWLTCVRSGLSGTYTVIVDVFCVKCNTSNN